MKETKKREKAVGKGRKELTDAEKKQIKAARMEKAEQAAVTKLVKGEGQGMGEEAVGEGLARIQHQNGTPCPQAMTTKELSSQNPT